MAFNAEPYSCVVHPFHGKRIAYERGSSSRQNALVFIGGLGDGPHTVGYVRAIAEQLEANAELNYSLFELRLSTAFEAYGYGSLKTDVAELSELVDYLRKLGKKKIVFLGHSTGCQDCMEYADYAGNKTSPIDGFILQAPVSDREGFGQFVPQKELDESIKIAQGIIKKEGDKAFMPSSALPPLVSGPMTAYRWNSLLSEGGDDDYFSSDFDDDKLARFWSRYQQPVMVLHSEKDETVPDSIDVAKLRAKWKRCAAPGIFSEFSGSIPAAGHNVSDSEGQAWMSERVLKFLRTDVAKAGGN